MKHLLTTLLLLGTTLSVNAEIRLPEIFSDHAVIQQQTRATIWGWATKGSVIRIQASWSESPVCADADENGYWVATIPTAEATFTPQTLTILEMEGGKKKAPAMLDQKILSDLLLGEVWFCSGQSNMEMPLNGFWNCPIEKANAEIALSASQKGIRFCTIPKTGYSNPHETVGGKWVTSEPANAPWFSATGYFFAKHLTAALGIPVGIINCSWGGSKVEGWTPDWKLREYTDFDLSPIHAIPADEPTSLYHEGELMYNGMLHPLTGFTARGFVWYQGEANVGKDTYAERLETMVGIWKDEWKVRSRDPEIGRYVDAMPFLIVEIAPWNGYSINKDGLGTSGAYLREQQFKASQSIPNGGFVCTNDLVYLYESEQIHPARKEPVGERLAWLALNKTYSVGNVCGSYPTYKSMEIKSADEFQNIRYTDENGRRFEPGKAAGKCIEVFFDNAADGLSPWLGIEGFEIAGSDKVFHKANAVLNQRPKSIVLWTDEVPDPVAVRYCFRDFQIGNLISTRSLPCIPFRSDNW